MKYPTTQRQNLDETPHNRGKSLDETPYQLRKVAIMHAGSAGQFPDSIGFRSGLYGGSNPGQISGWPSPSRANLA